MIPQSARDYLEMTKQVKVAHLVSIELAGSIGVYEYLTDYKSDVTYDNKVFEAGKVLSVGSVTLTQGLTNYKVNIRVPGEYQDELDKATTDASYEGRKLKITRAYIGDNGSVLHGLILFEGQVVDIKLQDNVTSGSSVVTWECAGDLQDFEKVAGRITEDADHRGLISVGGVLEPSNAAKRPEYKTDTGFQHAGQTVATSIAYLTNETEYYFKKKWHGLGGSLRTREVEVEKEIDLKLSLESKYLPVIYGVRKVQGIPVFLDTHQEKPTRMVAIFAVCEGEIDGFLNVYVDGVSTLCGPGVDSEESGTCFGDMAAGDTLALFGNAASQSYRQDRWQRFPYDRDERAIDDIPGRYVSNPAAPRDAGTTHGDTVNIPAEGGAIKMTFYHGKPDQEPDAALVARAASNGFLLQNNLKKADGSSWGPEYWSPKTGSSSGSALLDTAYVVCEFDISEDRSTLPSIEFVVKGRPALSFRDTGTQIVTEYKQTLNPVWHVADYICNPRFGMGIDPSVLVQENWIATANRQEVIDTSYDASYLKSWKYLGWDSRDNANRAIMQCNTLIDTSSAVTKEVEGLLSQFKGSIVPLRGYYDMSVENDDAPVAHLGNEDLIGSIKIDNPANRDKWNSINASIQNPEQNWSSSTISFFDSNYLDEDKGIRKQGRVTFASITNYYTARTWAKYNLDNSRFGKKVTVQTYFKYAHLKPNDNITLTLERYNFVAPNNKFRVVEVTDNPSGTLDLVLQRYEPFEVGTQGPNEPTGGAGEVGFNTPPKNLIYSILPTAGINISTPPNVLCGLLYWDLPNNDIDVLRYEISGYGDIKVAPKSSKITIGGQEKQYYLLEGLTPSTSYEFKVSTVYKNGRRSAYSIVTTTTPGSMTPPTLDPVTGFSVSNLATDGSFTGGDLELVWDTYNEQNTISSLQISILDANTDMEVYSTTVSKSLSAFTFTFSLNSGVYSSIEAKSGAYRYLKPRIRAVSGGVYSDWSNI